MNDGVVLGPSGLEVVPDRRGVQRFDPQRTGERSTSFRELQALQVGVQPGTPTRADALRIDHGEGLAVGDRHHPQQDGPLVPYPATHTRSHWSDRMADIARCTRGEPDPWPSTGESTALAHSSGPTPSGGADPPSSERMSIRQPVSLAASRAF